MTRASLITAAGAWVALLCVAMALTILAASNDRLPGDVLITDWLQDLSVPGEDFSDFVRTVTETEVVLATGAALTLLLWQRGYRRQAVLLGAGLFLLALLQPSLKELADRPRPDAELVKRRAGFDSTSFPSGHVMSATFLYGALFYFSLTLPLGRVPRLVIGLVAVFFLAMTPIVSVWLGIHWPSDVLGSWLWSLVLLLPLIVLDRSEAPPDEPEFTERSRE